MNVEEDLKEIRMQLQDIREIKQQGADKIKLLKSINDNLIELKKEIKDGLAKKG